MQRGQGPIALAALVLAGMAITGAGRAWGDGQWDYDFGTSGLSIIPHQVANATNSSKVLLAQPDGKILIFGLDYVNNVVYGRRLFPNGSIDSSFEFVDDVPGTQVFPTAGMLLDDGRIFIAGQRGSFLDGTLVAWMIMPNGTVDVNFGDAGRIEHDLPFEGDNIRAVARGPGDTLLVGSFGKHVTGFGSWTAMGITRLESDGDLDHTWNVSGTVVRNWRTNPDANDLSYLRTLALESDGGVLIGGRLLNGVLGSDHAAVGRLSPTGAFDTGFGTSGRKFLQWKVPGYDTWGSDVVGIARLADGGILLAGNYLEEPADRLQFGTARLTEIGGTDTNYSLDGLTFNSFDSIEDSTICCLAIDAAGRTVVAGWTGSSSAWAYAIARFLPSGELDLRLGGDGTAWFSVSPFGTSLGTQALALQSDGGILLAGDVEIDDGGGASSAMFVQRILAGLPFRDGFESDSAWFWDLP
jgi:uncharacterized delta-60 repeat protein